MITIKKFKTALLPIVFGAVVLSSCNKDVQQFAIPPVAMATGITLDSTLKTTDNDSMYYRLVVKASLGPTNFVNLLKGIGSANNTYTLFVPDNAAMIASGFSSALISAIPVASAIGIVSYNIIPQTYDTASIPNVFPNFPVGTLIFPAPSAPFLTFRTFPSKRPGILRVNRIPMTTPLNVKTSNGIIHHVAAIIAPPNPSFLWNRIANDTTPSRGLTYLKAAILRADSGTGTPGTLQSALLNAAANLTVFAPTDAVFQGTLTALITQGLIAQGVPAATAAAQAAFLASTPAVFSNPLLFGTLTATTVKGILVYHLFSNTAFRLTFQ